MKRLLRPVLHRYLLLFVIVAATLAGLAQSSSTPPAVVHTPPAIAHTPSDALHASLDAPHTLLWRISGKGLQKPSYLYGTMHLNDKRLFQFGDSVYRAIEKTEGLAIEVNPDEMAAYFVNKLFDREENGKKLNELLDQSYFDSHRKALAKKFKKPAEEISASDVLKEKHKWMADYMKKGEMPTFMDAYLYNIARRQGKWLGGIEDISDQTSLLSDLVDQSDVNYLLQTDNEEGGSKENPMLEKMIHLYAAQDLEGLQAVADLSTPEQKDKLLLRRNVKMARRIDSLAALRTMFFAIGSAHLAGDSGVIDLLRKKGFSVEPVFSSKKIASGDYTFQEVHLPWTPVTGEQGSYTVEMPANPATVHLYGLIEMKFLLDLFNMSGFCTTAMISPVRPEERDSLFSNTAKRMFQGENVPPVRNLDKNGIPGKEYIYSGSNGNLRIQVFADGKMVYLVIMSAIKKEALQSADADKFFLSFVIHNTVNVASTVTTFTDSVMGISFVTPAAITYNEKLSNNKSDTWQVSSYTGIDRTTGAVVILVSKAIKAGYHIEDLTSTYESMDEILKAQYDHLQKDSTFLGHIKMMRYDGRNIQQPEIAMSAAAAVKDGRQTILMVISDSAGKHSSALKEVFHSFRFIPYASAPWNKYGSPDHTFSFYGPSPARTDLYGNSVRWVSYDTATATSYLIIPDTMGKYAWYTSDSAFWGAWLGNDTAHEQLLELKDVVNGDVAGKEYLTRSSGNSVACARTRLLVNGDKLYKLFAFGERQLLYSPEVNRFFDTFRFNNAEPPSVTQSKAALLLHDLGSDDSATSFNAYRALDDAPFRKKDAALLRDALFRSYKATFDTSLRVAINYNIARELAGLDDSVSADFVRASYPSLAKEKQPLRNAALALLMHQHDAYSYAALAALLQQGPTTERLEYNEIYSLVDSLALTARIFPAMLPWAKDTLHAPTVATIALELVDSGYLSKDSLMSNAGMFIGAAAALLPGLKTSEKYDDSNLSFLVELIGRIRTPAAYSLLKSYLSVKSNYLLSKTVTQLLEGQQTVPPAVLHRLAADPLYRIGLYDDLKKQHKTALFPKDYLTQSSFAMAAIHVAADDEDEGVLEGVTFLSKRTASYHGRSYTFYLYKMCYTGSEGSSCYLGVAGGFDPAGAGMTPKKDLTYVYRDEPFDEKHAGTLFKKYLKWLDEED